MIEKCIVTLADKKGSSRQAIGKLMKANYPNHDPRIFLSRLKKLAVGGKSIVRDKGRFKLEVTHRAKLLKSQKKGGDKTKTTIKTGPTMKKKLSKSSKSKEHNPTDKEGVTKEKKRRVHKQSKKPSSTKASASKSKEKEAGEKKAEKRQRKGGKRRSASENVKMRGSKGKEKVMSKKKLISKKKEAIQKKNTRGSQVKQAKEAPVSGGKGG
jgi:hypothetical protein